MKKILAALLTVAFVCSLSFTMVGCGGNKTPSKAGASGASGSTGGGVTSGATTKKE